MNYLIFQGYVVVDENMEFVNWFVVEEAAEEFVEQLEEDRKNKEFVDIPWDCPLAPIK